MRISNRAHPEPARRKFGGVRANNPAPETVKTDTPLRLGVAAKLAFPDGLISARLAARGSAAAPNTPEFKEWMGLVEEYRSFALTRVKPRRRRNWPDVAEVSQMPRRPLVPRKRND